MIFDSKITNRIKRMEGQLRGILRMIDEGKDCKEVITQLSAVRSGIDHAIGVIVSENLVECVHNSEDDQSGMNESIQEAVSLLVKSR